MANPVAVNMILTEIFVTESIGCPKSFKLLILKLMSDVMLDPNMRVDDKVLLSMVNEMARMEIAIKTSHKYFKKCEWLLAEETLHVVRYALDNALTGSLLVNS